MPFVEGKLVISEEHRQAVGEHIAGELERYVNNRVPTGDFLEAVLQNNFMESFGRADSHNFNNMQAIATCVYQEVPFGIRGSVEKVNAWLHPEQGSDESIPEE